MNRGVLATIQRVGTTVDVLERVEGAKNEFNNPSHEWQETGEAECVRTYPNRNTQQDSNGGPFSGDNPLFIFESGTAPPASARIRYNGTLYELQSETRYDTHVAIFGEIVTG